MKKRYASQKLEPTYQCWLDMHRRCKNATRKEFANYGGRGIVVCPEWNSYNTFLKDLGVRPNGLTLERKDNERGYNKNNCEWANRFKQNQNKRKYNSNSSGVTGVSWDSVNENWFAYANRAGSRIRLYLSKDFFEACCARKSWEVKQ